MKHTVGTAVAVTALSVFVLAGCGGGDAGAPASTAPASPATTSSNEPAAQSATPSPGSASAEKDKVFVTDVRAKVASGDYTPTKESTKKSRDNIKSYMADLTDDRLAAVGEYNCQIKKEVTKAGMKSFGRRDFEKLELKNTGLEEGFKPLLGLTWDEAVKTICPG